MARIVIILLNSRRTIENNSTNASHLEWLIKTEYIAVVVLRHKAELSAILLILGSMLALTASSDDDPVKSSNNIVPDQSVVLIANKKQTASGLKTTVVTASQHHAEIETTGKVVSVEPLLVLRERFLLAKSDLDSNKAKLKQAEIHLKRQQDLYREGIAAQRTVQEQEAQTLSDRALVAARQATLTAITNEARLLWGETLAEMALVENPAQLQEFISGQSALLQIFLPSNTPLPSEIRTAWIEPNGQRTTARPSILVSRARHTDVSTPGESFYFRIAANNLTIGAKVSAWLPNSTLALSGIAVSTSALLWYMDQAYVYVKIAEDTFARRAVKTFSQASQGYLIQEGLKAGEEVVTTGGQMLLSEELRGQIPDED